MYEYGGSGESTILVPGFSVKRRIGVGGFATVYEAVQEDVQAPVALKVLAVDHTDERVRARFERECKTMGRLRDQRGIVAVYQSAFTSDGRPVIVMAYMPGGSLLDRLRQAGTLSVEEVTTIGVTLSRALQAAHDQGIYHRDIKPENILIDRDGQVALADFGLATVDDLLTSTRTDASLTPPHAPPERFLATEDTNLAAGDIYSLASTLHQLLTGRPPFGTSSDGGLAALINRVIADPPPNIDRPDMTAGLANAIVLGLSKNPNDRPLSPNAFGELLAPGMIAQASTDPGLLPLPTDRVAIPVVIPAVDSTPAPTTMPTRAVAPVVATVAAQWLADPSGRFTLRYWDGELWTGHVTRGNETLWDPLESPAASIPGSIVASATSMPTRAQTPTPAQTSTPTSMPTRVVAPVTISGQQPPTGSPPTKRKRGLIMIAIALAVLVIGGGAFAMNGGGDSQPAKQSANKELTTTTTGANGGESSTTIALPTGETGSTTLPGTKISGPGVVATTNTTSSRTVTLPPGGAPPPTPPVTALPQPPAITATVQSLSLNVASISLSVNWYGQLPGTCTGTSGNGCTNFTVSGNCQGFTRVITARDSFGQTTTKTVSGTFADVGIIDNANLILTSPIARANVSGFTYRFTFAVRNDGPPRRIPQLIAVLHRIYPWQVADTFDSNVCLNTGQSYTLSRTALLSSGEWLYRANWGNGAGVWWAFQYINASPETRFII